MYVCIHTYLYLHFEKNARKQIYGFIAVCSCDSEALVSKRIFSSQHWTHHEEKLRDRCICHDAPFIKPWKKTLIHAALIQWMKVSRTQNIQKQRKTCVHIFCNIFMCIYTYQYSQNDHKHDNSSFTSSSSSSSSLSSSSSSSSSWSPTSTVTKDHLERGSTENFHVAKKPWIFSCFSTGMDHLKPQYPIMKRNQYSLHFSCIVDSISIMPHTCLFNQLDLVDAHQSFANRERMASTSHSSILQKTTHMTILPQCVNINIHTLTSLLSFFLLLLFLSI